MAATERPRRSTRTPAKAPTTVVQATPSPMKRKARDSAAQLDYLITNSRSKLTSINIYELINYENFLRLDSESQGMLCSLLPATAFNTHQRSLHLEHPANSTREVTESQDESPEASSSQATMDHSPATLDPSFFTNSFFLSAARTFQDHLSSGLFTPKAAERIRQFEEGVCVGTMHAQWKDEEWEQSHKPQKSTTRNDLDLVTLVRRGQLREGDILHYKRRFSSPPVLVEKELLIRSINPRSGALDLLLQPKTDCTLPTYLLPLSPAPAQPPILTMEETLSSLELEEGILDVDGRVPRDARAVARSPVADISTLRVDFAGVHADQLAAIQAAKALSVWRWNEDRLPELELQGYLTKGGREYCGTVFYLRRA